MAKEEKSPKAEATAETKAPAKKSKKAKAKKAAPIKDKKLVRIGTLTLPPSLHKNVKDGQVLDGKVTDEGKAARKEVADYFKKQFGLDVVTKFAKTANDNEGKKPGFMIIARNLDEQKSSLFSTAIKISHKRGNFIELNANKKGEVQMVKLADMANEVADGLREYRDLARSK